MNVVGRGSNVIAGAVLLFMLGLSVGGIAVYMILVAPLERRLTAREQALDEWERTQRAERAAIAQVEKINVDVMRKWVAVLDEQNVQIAEIRSRLHQQEAEIRGPALSHLVIVTIFLLTVVGLVVFWLRDGNREAALTLEAAIDMTRPQLLSLLSGQDKDGRTSLLISAANSRLAACRRRRWSKTSASTWCCGDTTANASRAALRSTSVAP